MQGKDFSEFMTDKLCVTHFFSCSANQSCRQAGNNFTYRLCLVHGSNSLPPGAFCHSLLRSWVLPPDYRWHYCLSMVGTGYQYLIMMTHQTDWPPLFLILQVHKWPLQVEQYLYGSYSKKESLCFKSNSVNPVTLQKELHLASALFL